MAVNSSNLPTSRLFRLEDFPDADPWFQNFLLSLNLFVDPVYQILNGGVTYQNLTVPKLYTVTITTTAAGAATFNFVNPLRIQPSAVLIGNIYESGKPTAHPSSATSVYWNYSQNNIYVTGIPNLTASTSYAVTLVVL